MKDPRTPLTVSYRNWRGEVSERTITPKRVWFGSTDWHPEPQWLVEAYDHDKQAMRDFALADFGAQLPVEAIMSEEHEIRKGMWAGLRQADMLGCTHAAEGFREALGLDAFTDPAPQPAASVDREALVKRIADTMVSVCGMDTTTYEYANSVADALIAAGMVNRPEAVVRATEPVGDKVEARKVGGLCAGCGVVTDGKCYTDCGMSLCGEPLCDNCEHIDERYGWRHQPREETARPASIGEGWQPIETAPKDGTNILITGGGPDYHYDNHHSDPPVPEMVVAWWSNRDGGFWRFCSYDGGVYGVWRGPTNWMPLPRSTREGE